jgi:hypothetical protein
LELGPWKEVEADSDAAAAERETRVAAVGEEGQ